MYYLFKLMFVLNCESRGLLCVDKTCDYYIYSLRKKCVDIKEQSERGQKWSSQARTYRFMKDLFELLKNGDKRIGVHGFGKEPFEIKSDRFYSKNKLSDKYLNKAILDLSFDPDGGGNQYQFIDYKILSPDHIGSLYESLLELNLEMKKNKFELLNTRGDRKSTGSYYTPEYLVNYIIEETLKPLVIKKTPKEILGLKILDPSMGSGHFLLGVVRYLENTITSLQDSDGNFERIDFDKIRREVLKNCVFGVDINPLATQLAKLSLWIYTSQKRARVEPLKGQLITYNALVDDLDYSKCFNNKISEGNVDAIVGNPPYIGEKGNKEKFQLIKMNSLGKRFYHGKMDYFYFFIHLALDLTKKMGRVGYITTNYFPTAYGAKRLRIDLKNRAKFTKTINFGNYKIFKNAQGQHSMISFLEKSNRDVECESYSLKGSGTMNEELFSKALWEKRELRKIKNTAIYDGKLNYIRLDGIIENEKIFNSIFQKMKSTDKTLGCVLNINTGLFTACDKVFVFKK